MYAGMFEMSRPSAGDSFAHRRVAFSELGNVCNEKFWKASGPAPSPARQQAEASILQRARASALSTPHNATAVHATTRSPFSKSALSRIARKPLSSSHSAIAVFSCDSSLAEM